MTKKKTTKQQQYTWEFQQRAVQLARTTGKPAATIAAELGVPVWRMRAWLRDASDKAERCAETNELLRLQNEIKALKEENEFLKKASAYFAKLQP